MIDFSCDNCGYEISVADDQAGRRGRCPGCAGTIVVPERDILISLLCENCGERISALPSHSGKQGRCPKCRTTLAVPVAHDLTLLDMEKLEEIKKRQRAESEFPEQADKDESELEAESPDKIEPVDERQLPWFVDIFLYPLSTPGLKHLVLFIGVLPATTFLESLVPGPLIGLAVLAGWVVRVLVLLYMYWYIAACIRDSADGWVRAPEGVGSIPDLGDLFWQGVNVVGCLGILFGPALVYVFATHQADIVFWLLAGAGFFLYPMALLASVMFDSPGGIGPTLLPRSIKATFSGYCRLVLLFCVVGVLIIAAMTVSSQSRLAGCILGAVCVYLALITAHLTGRFYWRHSKELKWMV